MHNPRKDHLWLLILAILCAVSLVAAVVALAPATPGPTGRAALGTFVLVLLGPLVHRLTGHAPLTLAFAVGAVLGVARHLGDPGVAPGLLAATPIAVLAVSGRPARRWVPLALAFALTCVAVAATFFTAPVTGERRAVAATMLDAPMGDDDPPTHVDVSIDVERCANPVHVYVVALFPRVRRQRILPRLQDRPGFSAVGEPFSGMTTIVPDARVDFTQESNAPRKVHAYWANWIERRGIGSCYLRVPEVSGWAAAEPYARLGVDTAHLVVSGSVVVHTPLDVSRGPADDVSTPSLTRRRCGDFSESCAADLVLTQPWRGTFEDVMLLVIGALFSVLAELAMRRTRRATRQS